MNILNKILAKLRIIKNKMKKYPYLYNAISKCCIKIREVKTRLEIYYYVRNKVEDQINALCRGMEYSYEESAEYLKKIQAKDKKHIAFLITEYEEINNTGDKYSAMSLGEQLKEVNEDILISYYVRDPRIEWANVNPDIDFVIIMDPEIDKSLVKKLPNKKIAWIRGNYNSWIKKGYLELVDYVIVTSEVLKERLIEEGFKDKVLEVISLGIPIDVQRKLKEVNTSQQTRHKDVVFVGNIYDIERDIVKNLDVDKIENFCFYGNIKDNEHKWQKYNKGKLMHKDITEVYLDTKIVIEDIAPFNKGTVNLRVFEAAASGCLVISNYDEALLQLFGDAIELYRTKEELNKKIAYYLEHEEERRIKARTLQEIVLDNYTFKNEAIKLTKKINSPKL